MKYTNVHNLPDRIIRQLPVYYPPKEKRISVTDLINPPRIRTLQIEKWDQIEIDYSDLLSTIFGLSLHERQDRLVSSDEESETKFEDIIDGITLVGRSDNYDLAEKVIRDTKVIPVDRLNFQDFFTELEKQLNIYAYQRRLRDQEVKGLEGDFYFRDWKKREADKDAEKWAVMKKGQKRAVRLFDTGEEAVEFAYQIAGYVEHRESTGYPQIPVKWSVPVNLWTFEKQKEFV